MTLQGREVEVAAPAAARPRVGLIPSARTDFTGEDERWVNGITFRSRSCGTGGAFDPDCGIQEKDIPSGERARVDYMPFAVWAGDRCSAGTREDYAATARELLEAVEDFQIEREFWRGDIAQAANHPNAFLASDDADVIGSGPIDVVDALASLEGALRTCGRGQRGMIHATSEVVTLWSSRNLLRREGAYILTIHDTIVVPGAGYDGSGPGDEPAVDGSVWAYATGLVDVRRSSIDLIPGADDIASALDRSTNTIEFRAECFAAATWDQCCHLAIEIDAPVHSTGGS